MTSLNCGDSVVVVGIDWSTVSCPSENRILRHRARRGDGDVVVTSSSAGAGMGWCSLNGRQQVLQRRCSPTLTFLYVLSHTYYNISLVLFIYANTYNNKINILKSKCIPMLIYDLECFSLPKSDPKTLDFAVTWFLMKLK